MDVPEKRANGYVLPLKSTVSMDVNELSVYDEIEDATETPGADISGFNTSSYRGPILEKLAIIPPANVPFVV
jgi:hypothetical protein